MWLGHRGRSHPTSGIGDIGAAIYEYAGKELGYGVVEAFCGHGIGREFHMQPQVSSRRHAGAAGPGSSPGMTFTIEPMINVGTPHCDILDDNWTAVTRDGKRSAQVEHTILVTDTGYEVLTMRDSAWRPADVPIAC